MVVPELMDQSLVVTLGVNAHCLAWQVDRVASLKESNGAKRPIILPKFWVSPLAQRTRPQFSRLLREPFLRQDGKTAYAELGTTEDSE